MNPPNQINFYSKVTSNAATNGDLSNTSHTMTKIVQEQIAAINIQNLNVTADQWFYENLNNTDRLDIRLAMDYAISRQNIFNTILDGYGNLLATWVTPYFSNMTRIFKPDF